MSYRADFVRSASSLGVLMFLARSGPARREALCQVLAAEGLTATGQLAAKLQMLVREGRIERTPDTAAKHNHCEWQLTDSTFALLVEQLGAMGDWPATTTEALELSRLRAETAPCAPKARAIAAYRRAEPSTAYGRIREAREKDAACPLRLFGAGIPAPRAASVWDYAQAVGR